MDLDSSSFEDISSSGGKKFIALEVSDHSDFDDSYNGINNHTNASSTYKSQQSTQTIVSNNINNINHTTSSSTTPHDPDTLTDNDKNCPRNDIPPFLLLRRPTNRNNIKNRGKTKRYSMFISSDTYNPPSTSIDNNINNPIPTLNNTTVTTSNTATTTTTTTASSSSTTTTTTSISTTNDTPQNEDKRRWSFMSNHSSSSKKRWSTLSSFTLDSVSSNNSNKNHNHNSPSKSNKRQSSYSLNKKFSTASNISVATTTTSTNNTDVISFHNKNTSIDNISIHTQDKSITSMKRSSTGSSLRQFLTNFVSSSSSSSDHNNHTLDPNYNKENKLPDKNNFLKNRSHAKTTTSTSTISNNHIDNRNPLQRININDQHINNTNNNSVPHNRPLINHQYANSSSTYNLDDATNRLNHSMETLSIQSKRSSISSLSSQSSLSKWKFWKKNSNSYNNSTNHNYNYSLSSSSHQRQRSNFEINHGLKNSTSSYSINISSFTTPTNENNNNNNNNNNNDNNNLYLNKNLPHSSSTRTLHTYLNERPLSIYSHDTNKLRNKNSLSDFHKSFYKTNNGSITNSIHNIADLESELSIYSNLDYNNSNHNVSSLKKKSSTLSLTISGLKHRTSQHSLKHKTSHSSLQKFKTRRKSTNDDGSSFLTSTSSINSGHSSHNGDNSSSTVGACGPTSNPRISLPIPNQVSRDKIRTKLKNSTSLLSLNSNIPVDKRTYDETILNQLLQLCTVKYVIDSTDLDSERYRNLEVLSSNHSIQLSNNVWRSRSTLDPNQTIICKKFILSNDNDDIILKELQILSLCKTTPGLPQLLQSYIVGTAFPATKCADTTNMDTSTNEDVKTLYIFLKDHGDPITEVIMKSWSQCLKIFWQCVNILYVAETKFEFEHRNLTLNHILIDKNGTVTLCDLSMSRANYGDNTVLFTRLDHPMFFRSGQDYLFDTYHAMRSIFIQHGEQWSKFEARTNILWLRYVAKSLFTKNKDNKSMGPEREQLVNIISLLDHYSSFNGSGNKRGSHIFNKRRDHDIKSSGDLLRYK